MQHVATWKEGDEKWAYHEDAFAQIASHKVSLDPYRLESRKILDCIKDVLPPSPFQRVEKASIDEVFLDLSSQVHSILIERYPEISGPAPYDDPTELLPRPPTSALDWNSDALVDLDITETEDDDPDWDDIAILVGSEIVRTVRAAIRERLKYTCSAGIARNKMIAKLGSAHKKPNQQTIVRNRAVQNFLGGFKFTKIRNLGGKLGEDVAAKFGTDEVKDLLVVGLEKMKCKIGDDTGSWVYEVIRGNDLSEVNSRTQIKSMLSAKSFRPSINTFEQATRWLRIFAADIFSRLVEEGVLENKRRPKTMNLHHRQGAQMRSRQGPIHMGRLIDETLIFDIAKNLLGQIVADGRVWPCSNLQLSVGGFEDGPTGNRGIDGFLVRGYEAKAMRATIGELNIDQTYRENNQPEKRRKSENGVIERFLVKKDSSDGGDNLEERVIGNRFAVDDNLSAQTVIQRMFQETAKNLQQNGIEKIDGLGNGTTLTICNTQNDSSSTFTNKNNPALQATSLYLCDQCNIPILGDKEEHRDWHFAKALQSQERSHAPPGSPQSALSHESKAKGGKNRPSSLPIAVGKKRTHLDRVQEKPEKGQRKLKFET